MHDVKHCTVTAGKHSFAGLVVADLEWQEADTQTGDTRGYIVTDASLVDFPLMADRIKDYAYDSEPDDGVIDLDITIEIDGHVIGTTLDGVIEGGRLVKYTLDLIGNDIDAVLDRAFNDE